MQSKIIIDKDFTVYADKRTFQYVENGISKRLPASNLVSCEVYADLSMIGCENVKKYIKTSYGIIPFFEDSSELMKMVSSAGTVLIIYFTDETGEIKSYRKRYEKDETIQYKIKCFINKLMD